MLVKINGKAEELDKKQNLAELILAKGLVLENIVIEHNGNIISQGHWPEVLLEENDNIEIVSFVSGG